MTPPQLLARAGQNEPPFTQERLDYLRSQIDAGQFHRELYNIPAIRAKYDAANPPAIAADGAGKEGA